MTTNRTMLQRLQTSLAGPAAATTLEGELVLPSDTTRPMRIGLWTLCIGLGGFLLWASLAPLDEGVPTQGMVTLDTKRKAIQHQAGGIVKEVFVKEGQFVKKGDPLIQLDDANAKAGFESVRQHYLTLRAMEGRLLAEQANQSKIVFHPDLIEGRDDPYIKQVMRNQEELLGSRRMALQSEMQAIRESIQGQEASIQGYLGMQNARKSQQQFLQEDLSGMRELVKDGYAPRAKLLEFERMAAESTGSIADLQGNIQRARSAIAEMKMRSILRTQEYRKEVETQLADLRREVQADADKYRAASQELARMTLRAPAEGQVVGLVVQSVGSVIGPGQKIMDVVPDHETLLLEARVPPHMIDRVHPDLPTDVRFSSFAHSPMLVLEGKVDSVSTDLIAEPQNPSTTYYLARVSITPEGLKELKGRQLQAGMPAEVVVRTGERSMLTYLLHPLLKRIAASMKEE
jgi:protease secretion system membrane fusion protein